MEKLLLFTASAGGKQLFLYFLLEKQAGFVYTESKQRAADETAADQSKEQQTKEVFHADRIHSY